jgi:hypothetical protein
MDFTDILAKLELTPSPGGHSLEFPGSPYNSGTQMAFPKAYLDNAVLLYANPILRAEVEEKVKVLVEGAIEANDMVTKEACRLSIKAILSLYDSLKMLHDRALEERERLHDDELNPGRGRKEAADDGDGIPGFANDSD